MLTVTATDLPRLMVCNGSRLMGGSAPSVKSDDTVRNEGNAADWLVGQVHSGQFAVEELVDRKAPNGVYITTDMVEYLEEYLSAIKDARVEVDTTHGTHAWQVNGRADLIKYDAARSHLDVGDLKYGWSIVEPENNWTLISHVIGFMKYENVLSATLTIYQPRPYHPAGRTRSVTLTRAEIEALWTELASTLSNPSDILNTSPQCHRCPAVTRCPAARKADMNAIDASEIAFIDTIDNDELSFQLDHLKRAIEILTQKRKAYTDLALHNIKEGGIVNNYSLEQGLTNRQWVETATPDLMKMLTGKDLVKPAQMITPAQAEKAGVSKEVVASFTERHNKAVKLVRVDANTQAKKLFKK